MPQVSKRISHVFAGFSCFMTFTLELLTKTFPLALKFFPVIPNLSLGKMDFNTQFIARYVRELQRENGIN